MESTSSSSGNNNTNNNTNSSSNNTNNNNSNNNNSNNTNDHKNDDFDNSKDEVDFAIVSTNNNNYTNNKNVGKKLVEYTTTTIPTTTTTIPTTTVSGDNNNSCSTNESLMSKTITKQQQQQQQEQSQQQQQQQSLPVPPQKETSSNNNNNSNTLKKKKKTTSTEEEKKPSSTKERLSLFSFNKKLSHKQSPTTTTTTTSEKSKNVSESSVVPATPPAPTPRQHKFVKSSSIARLLGNTYNAKKFEKEEQKRLANDGKFNTYAGRRRLSGPTLERFRSKEDGDDVTGLGPTSSPAPATMVTHQLRDLYGGSRNDLLALEQQQHHHHGDRHADFGAKAMRTLSRGLGKLWWRRSHSVDISTPDPEFKVSYLGNVLTGWAKGEGCVEKQLSTLWRNYTQNNKPDVMMRIKVCASGLKATTRQHGLTEYWANRITHCCAPKNYPRVFCWIYRHEGRKLKHELRCHAVLCSKEKIVQDICNTLKENLERALREFKREKILKQNARLSLANAAYENPSLPRRKILLSVGGNNYRPPLERSKSAPKLMAIEEAIGEEDGEEVEETNEPEMKPCCQKDSLYPAMTLGRRRCRRGHSIRRTGKARPTFCGHFAAEANAHKGVECCGGGGGSKHTKENQEPAPKTTTSSIEEEKQRHSYGSDESDDFDKLLKYNNYDSTSSLANEILPYFDMQLHKKPISSSMGSLGDLKDEDEEGEPLSLMPTINSNPSAHPDADFSLDASPASEEDPAALGLRRNGVCSDGEEDYLEPDDLYFRQASILNMLHRNSMRKMANISLSSDESSSIETNGSLPLQFSHQVQSSISSNGSSTVTTEGQQGASVGKQQGHAVDSDEGSISSGCETASTVTANQDDISLRYRQSKQQQLEEQQHQAMKASPSALRDDVGPELLLLEEEDHPVVSAEDIYQRLESRLHGRHGSDATTFSSSSSITLKMGGGGSSSSPTASLKGLEGGGNGNSNNNNNNNNASARSRKSRRPPTMIQCEQRDGDSDDSECSDESGYVEFQEREVSGAKVMAMVNQPSAKSKPLPPPKPMPRRLIGTTGATTAV